MSTREGNKRQETKSQYLKSQVFRVVQFVLVGMPYPAVQLANMHIAQPLYPGIQWWLRRGSLESSVGSHKQGKVCASCFSPCRLHYYSRVDFGYKIPWKCFDKRSWREKAHTDVWSVCSDVWALIHNIWHLKALYKQAVRSVGLKSVFKFSDRIVLNHASWVTQSYRSFSFLCSMFDK